ncbi:MAG: hypothetical protein ABSD44_11210 [Terracidiphilus sp.]
MDAVVGEAMAAANDSAAEVAFGWNSLVALQKRGAYARFEKHGL